MPFYKSRTVFELGGNLRAFLNLEAGLTRGRTPPATGEAGREASSRDAGQAATTDRAVALEKLANGPFGSLTEDKTFRPLKITQVALDDGKSGGGRAAYRLHAALRRLGHESSMFVINKHSRDPTVQAFEPPADSESRSEFRTRREEIRRDFGRYTETRPQDLVGYGFTGDRGVYGDAPHKQLPECDVINLHWFGNFLDYRDFFNTVPRNLPVVWTLHDMNAFTGGCHWDAGCGKFNEGCGACPQLGSTGPDDLSRDVWRRKREAFAGVSSDSLHLVSPSRWLAEVARSSALLGEFPVTTIHNSLDSQTFAPRDRKTARSALGIPQNAAVLLFVADSLVTVRKGFALLSEALNGMTGVTEPMLLSVGGFDPGTVHNVPHKHLDFVSDDLLLSAVYSAADLFVIPSLQDNLPQTAMEAMACGTPVVGFDVGGIPDMVRPGTTGELVPPGDTGALRQTMKSLLQDPEKRSAMSRECRRLVLEEFSHDSQAGLYVEVYRSLAGAANLPGKRL